MNGIRAADRSRGSWRGLTREPGQQRHCGGELLALPVGELLETFDQLGRPGLLQPALQVEADFGDPHSDGAAVVRVGLASYVASLLEAVDECGPRGLRDALRDINARYRESPAIWRSDADPGSFAWVEADDAAGNVFAFVRRSGDDEILSATNFAAMPHHGYRLGFPGDGEWEECLNTDAEAYGGSGVGNLGAVTAVAGEHKGWPAHAEVVLPPLSTVWFRRKR